MATHPLCLIGTQQGRELTLIPFSLPAFSSLGFPVGSVVKNLPVSAGHMVQSLGQEDPPGGGNSILAWESPRTEESRGPQSMGESDTT